MREAGARARVPKLSADRSVVPPVCIGLPARIEASWTSGR